MQDDLMGFTAILFLLLCFFIVSLTGYSVGSYNAKSDAVKAGIFIFEDQPYQVTKAMRMKEVKP